MWENNEFERRNKLSSYLLATVKKERYKILKSGRSLARNRDNEERPHKLKKGN